MRNPAIGEKKIPDLRLIEVSDDRKDLVLGIAHYFNLDFGVISTIETENGPLFYDINPIPNIEMIEKVYQIEVIPKLLRLILSSGESN